MIGLAVKGSQENTVYNSVWTERSEQRSQLTSDKVGKTWCSKENPRERLVREQSSLTVLTGYRHPGHLANQ